MRTRRRDMRARLSGVMSGALWLCQLSVHADGDACGSEECTYAAVAGGAVAGEVSAWGVMMICSRRYSLSAAMMKRGVSGDVWGSCGGVVNSRRSTVS